MRTNFKSAYSTLIHGIQTCETGCHVCWSKNLYTNSFVLRHLSIRDDSIKMSLLVLEHIQPYWFMEESVSNCISHNLHFPNLRTWYAIMINSGLIFFWKAFVGFLTTLKSLVWNMANPWTEAIPRSTTFVLSFVDSIFLSCSISEHSWLKALNIDHLHIYLLSDLIPGDGWPRAWHSHNHSHQCVLSEGDCGELCVKVLVLKFVLFLTSVTGSNSVEDELWLKTFPYPTGWVYPVWVLWCLVREELCVKAFPQSLHSYGFSPVWILRCWVRCVLCLKDFPQSWHS